MSLSIVFVTADAAVIGIVKSRRNALVPGDLRANGFAALGVGNVAVSAYDTSDAHASERRLVGWLTETVLPRASSVILLTDDTIPNLVENLGDFFSVHRFTPPGYGKQVANLLTATLTKILRAFRYFAARFEDRKYHQILRLPLRNFVAPEVAHLRAACRDMTHRGNYSRELDAVLHAFRSRQQPKKASSHPETYYVDDDQKHFRFGHEEHARAETAIPPHNAFCVIANCFRFGHGFDGVYHYNVSHDGDARMSGDYPDCHGVRRSGGKGSHLNLFTNDYF